MTASQLVLDVPRQYLLNANQMTRMHWRVKGQRAAVLKRLAALKAHGRRSPFPGRVSCTVTIRWPDKNRRRDAHNIMPTIKHLIDGIVDAGWLTDDNDRYLEGPDLRVDPDTTCPSQYACSLTFDFRELT